MGVVVLLRDATDECMQRRRLEAANADHVRESERLTKQNEELHERVRTLIAANAELSAANNELRNSNEHLLIAAEEAEASAEEVETLNEEMQATSEELETLNEELQATVEELNTTNEELGARSNELEKLAVDRQDQLRRSEEQRRMYEGAISEMPAPVAIVSPDGRILCVSNSYRELAKHVQALRDVGEMFVEPNIRDATVRTVNVDFDERPARLVFITSA
jgi:two-component system CheB/CheR fusion protein